MGSVVVLKLCYYNFLITFSFWNNLTQLNYRLAKGSVYIPLAWWVLLLSLQPGFVHQSYWQWRLTAWPRPLKLLAMETHSLALSTKATANGDSQPGFVHQSYWQWRLTAWLCPPKLLAMETRSLALSTKSTGNGDSQPGFVHQSKQQWRLAAWLCPPKQTAMETHSLALSTKATGNGDSQPGLVH